MSINIFLRFVFDHEPINAILSTFDVRVDSYTSDAFKSISFYKKIIKA